MTLIEKWRALTARALGRFFGDDVIKVHVFRDTAFAPDGNTIVCIALEHAITRFISIKELDHAFSGYVVYRKRMGVRYVGVWGQRNASRWRRFLRERGASLSIENSKPTKAYISWYKTTRKRRRVRNLGRVDKGDSQTT